MENRRSKDFDMGSFEYTKHFMGGLDVYYEMTDIDAFYVVGDARSISDEGTRNAFHRWCDNAIVIESRFLTYDSPQPLYFDDGSYKMESKGLKVLAHEIGHNIFNKFIDDNYPYYPIALTRGGREWTADQFTWRLGISPYHYNFEQKIRKFMGWSYGWKRTGTDNDYYDSILNHYNNYLGN